MRLSQAPYPFNPFHTSDPRFVNLVGSRFHHLLVISIYARRRKIYWLCLCDCKNITVVGGELLRSNVTKSCGCIRSASKTRHGQSTGKGTPEYNAYTGAKNRCNNPNNRAYKHYGGRGIEFRFDSFEEFYATIGDKPTAKHCIERIDNNGHYETGNIKWATQTEEQRNRRNNVWTTHQGVTRTQSEWSLHAIVGRGTFRNRLRKGWCIHCALTLPKTRAPNGCPHKPTSDP